MKQNRKLSNFILEVFVEEMPARLVNDLSNQLRDNFKKEIENQSIPYTSLRSFSTPRRLIIVLEGLSKKQKDSEKFVIGPPRKISITEKGELLKPGSAFIEKNNITKDDIEIFKKDNSEFIAANIKTIGQETPTLLTKASSEAINKIKNKKFMKWGSDNFQFIRPIKNLFLLFDSKFLNIEISNIKNENRIYGHRFHDNKGKKILSFIDYFKYMKKSFVEIDFNQRRTSIHNEILEIEKKLDVFIPIDKELLDHVANLTENPDVLCGSFDEKFLEVPKEVNISVMKNHQKYFPVFKDKELKKLDSKFIFIAGSTFLDKKTVVSGNEKVIRARLDDAKFFYNEDTNSGLLNIQKKLDSTTFIAGAGTYEDKSNRVHQISRELVKRLGLGKMITGKDLETACKIIKADLCSQMVFEFPELQGIMGRYYFEKQNPNIAEIIEQHYLPKGRNDKLPDNPIAMVISIADKLDTITCCFSLGLIPTGSSDPYGLRRNSIGIIRIAESLNKNLDLVEILSSSVDCFEANINKKVGEDSKNKAIEFFIDRVKNYFSDMSYQSNIINSVMNIDSTALDIKSIKDRASLIDKLNKEERLTSPIEAYKRLKNIVKENADLEINTKLLTNPFELSLYKRYLSIKELFGSQPMTKSPTILLNAIIETAPDLAKFFENVLVMDENIKVRQNRINLLTNIKKIISRFINLTEI